MKFCVAAKMNRVGKSHRHAPRDRGLGNADCGPDMDNVECVYNLTEEAGGGGPGGFEG